MTIGSAEAPSGLADLLWQLIDSLGVVENKAKLVAGSKTLHHLLPELVPPIDREWTGRFFNFHLPEWQDRASQRRIYQIAYSQFALVAQRVNPEKYVTGAGWRTSRTKILDNALIGFCKGELGEQPLQLGQSSTREISFEVVGYPPPKGEAISMLSDGHGHASRIQLLLEAAAHAKIAQGFTPAHAGPVELDVVVYAPPGQNRADATNLLGGIADVLEDKAHRGQLDHLGALADVWLYRNDRQIKAATYRELASDEATYTVTIRALAT